MAIGSLLEAATLSTTNYFKGYAQKYRNVK